MGRPPVRTATSDVTVSMTAGRGAPDSATSPEVEPLPLAAPRVHIDAASMLS